VSVKVTTLALLVYVSNYWLIPAFFYKKRYLVFAFLYLGMILAMGTLKVYVNSLMLQPYFSEPLFTDFKARFYDNIIPLFLLVSTGVGSKIMVDYMRTQRRLSEISRERAETELKFLKSQINPHFLFNSINSIYFLIDKNNPVARQTLLQFSQLLRYQLYDCNGDTIPVEKEMNYLRDYIELQQLRRDRSYEVKLRLDESVKDFKVVPLLMIPFVENAFKHISHFSHRPNTIEIMANRENGSFHLQVKNSKEPNPAHAIKEAGGIGLANVRRRLELLYPGMHKLDILDRGDEFSVHLELKLA
jgi:LytS/YehU family sensor histidine kinase